jgi:leucyl-tRNA synthetase
MRSSERADCEKRQHTNEATMSTAGGEYTFSDFERKWQRYWLEHKTFRTPQPGDDDFDDKRDKFYVLDMFPYPSGVGLHVGHPLGYIATDIYARYLRMRGLNVLHAMGYDAFGLPAEQYAIEHGVPPRETTQKNVDNMRAQLRRLGMGYDWDREIATTDVSYYRWTQWIFLRLFNSWYDPAEDRARPIAELQHKLEQEHLVVDYRGEVVPPQGTGLQEFYGQPVGTQRWAELTPEQRRAAIDNQRLAYMDEVPVNWCPALGTVLANEEVTNEGRSDRGNHPVYRRPLRQWMLRITKYADRLERDLDMVDWPEPIKLMQRNWIGRSVGAEVDFQLTDGGDDAEVIRVYTTRPDTLFGATYMVLAPEHELVNRITTPQQRDAVRAYVKAAAGKSELDRTADTKEKTGVPTGAYAINPVNGERIPVWIADYVLTGYGTGAIMAVPGHDTRDFEFAQKFDLPIVQVVQPPEGEDWRGYTGWGTAVNSQRYDGLTTPEFKKQITEWLERKGLGKRAVNYKLRDWLFSRQRYWGEPFPIVHDAETDAVFALDESELPVVLPSISDYRPEASEDPSAPPAPPLGRAKEWVNVRGYLTESGSVRLVGPGDAAPDGVQVRDFRRELNTMPQWAGSCWYYLRYLDPKNERVLVDPDIERYWMAPRSDEEDRHPGGVDLYVGGAEHAVLHLLYARFWHKVLYDLEVVSSPEPFARLFNQGYIQAYAYQDERGIYVDVNDVEDQGEGKDARSVRKSTGEPVSRSLGKMGKSLKNAVAPDDICQTYGTDTLRAYEMYMGPLEASKPWSPRDIVGMSRFLQGVWRRLVAEDGSTKVSDTPPDDALRRRLHRTIKKVTADLEGLRFNTAIAAMIELNNALSPDGVPRAVSEAFVKMLSPIAPHLCEELWQRMQGDKWRGSITGDPWPKYDEALCAETEFEIPVQISGKVRARITLPADVAASQERMQEAALADARVKALLEGKTIRKVVCIPGRMINIVAN